MSSQMKKSFSLVSRGLKYKLKVAFILMSVLPLLVCVYLLSNYLLPHVGVRVDIVLSVLITAFIAFVGFLLLREIFNRILSLNNEVKLIAAGDLEREIEVFMEDEVGDLAHSLNEVTASLRLLLEKIEKLEIYDTPSGLYNKGFIYNCLQEEIKRAILYQRPCAFILFYIDNFQKFRFSASTVELKTVFKKFAHILKGSVSEVDRVARFADDEFAVVLPEKTKRQAYQIAEEIRRRIEEEFSRQESPERRFTLSGSVSENPLDGITAEELINKARELLNTTKDKGKNLIVV